MNILNYLLYLTHIIYIIVLNQYNITVRRVNLSGPTSFAPIIQKAIELVKSSDNQVSRVLYGQGSNIPIAISAHRLEYFVL